MQQPEAWRLIRMAELWHQPPSYWFPHLHPLQRYHLDQALYAKWREQETRNAQARAQERPFAPLPAPRGGPGKRGPRVTPEIRERFAPLMAQIKARRQAAQERAG